tara:strand:- start:5708 stop:5920 length:213 start_codon:yes stop_codon:yes gene_type:complete
MKANEKNPEIDAFLTSITGRDRVECVGNYTCATCGGPANIFRDALSSKEFGISGMCQDCQDKVFGVEEVY